jgi:ATP-binding cassette, subfamily B, bacterial MsbA
MKLFKRLIRYVFPFKGNIVLILLFNILYSIFSIFSLTMVVPFLSVLFGQTEKVAAKPEITLSIDSLTDTFYYYMGVIIERSGQISALIYIAVTMIILSFFSNLFRYLGQYCLAPIRAGILRSFRKDIYNKIIILPLSFYSDKKKGDVMNRIGSDVQEVEWSIISTIQTFCRDPFLMIVYLITLFSVSYKLTLVSLVVLPLSGYIIAVIGKSIKRNSVKAQQILGMLSSKYEEAISGLRIIKGYNAIDHASAAFKQENKIFSKINTKIYRVNDLGSPLIEFLSILSITVILLIGGKLVLFDPSMQGELLVMYLLVFARMIPPAKQLVAANYTIQKGMASAQRIYQIIDGEEVITELPDPVRIDTFKDRIEYKNVGFSYHENPLDDKNTEVLHGINITLKKGEVIALAGSSGSGKSTLVDLLPRFYDVSKGKIMVDGIDIKKYCISDLRELFGIVNQDVILFNDTVFNNIAFGKKDVTEEMVIEAAKIAQAHDFILEMENGYDTVIGDRGMKLSGGQRQRLSIARAILKNPQVLILDEATSALDNESEYLFQQALDTILKNRTAILIAHRLSTIRHTGQIFFVDNGRIVECGTHDELMHLKGAYYKFCLLQKMN